ncbi:MAG: preprotein translocase subunit SecG [Myxococcota bacterium]
MVTALYILHVIVCLAMLPIILLQSGKGGGVSAVFGGGSSGNVFGSRGASTFLTRMTTGAAIVFMCTSMGLAYVSSNSSSVIDQVDLPEPAGAESVGVDESAPVEASAGDPAEAAEGGIQIQLGEPADDGQKD